jgi:hypothetical protein
MTSTGCGICIVSFDQQQILPISIRNVINESFEELSSCISFIEQQTKEDNVVVLITTNLEENILQKFELLTSIEGILILSTAGKALDTLPSKVIGIHPQGDSLLRSLWEILDIIEIQLTVKSLLFHRQKDGDDNLDFYFYYLWKNYTKDQNSTKKSFAEYSRQYIRHNNQINDFETSYKSSDVLSWFDKHRHPFPYYLLLSNAFRKHNQEILSQARFFLNDFSKQTKPAPSGQVYLGIKLPLNFIDELEQQTKTDIIAFQCFLPVTRSRATALDEATRPIRRQKMTNVLFKIDLNNTLCAGQDDTLFIDIGTPFHISCVTRSSGAGSGQQLLTIVKLMALDKQDREQLFEQFIQRQLKLGRTVEDLLQKLGSDIRLDDECFDPIKIHFLFLLVMMKFLLINISLVVNGHKPVLFLLV